MRAVYVTVQMKLFSLYVLEKQMCEALKLGNDVMESKHINEDEHALFIVQAIFRRMNDSKMEKIMKKKL